MARQGQEEQSDSLAMTKRPAICCFADSSSPIIRAAIPERQAGIMASRGDVRGLEKARDGHAIASVSGDQTICSMDRSIGRGDGGPVLPKKVLECRLIKTGMVKPVDHAI